MEILALRLRSPLRRTLLVKSRAYQRSGKVTAQGRKRDVELSKREKEKARVNVERREETTNEVVLLSYDYGIREESFRAVLGDVPALTSEALLYRVWY